MIERRVACGRLHQIHNGVYAVCHPNISREGRWKAREGRWKAATLACGPGGVLSHRSAAAHLGMRESNGARIDVSSPARTGRSRRGITVHSCDTLASADVAVVHAIPCTTVARTILD